MKKPLQLLLILNISFLLFSCKEDKVSNPLGNTPPTTGLFLYPDSTVSPQPSQIRVHWWGDDPDGLIAGFFFSWDGENWSFTTSNDSVFSLDIGANDTTYTFWVAAADDQGNGIYDNTIFQNGMNFGSESFTDLNGNGIYDQGEPFIDIGLIDPAPASFSFPLTNTAPTIQWSDLTVLPEVSFPVMSFGWIAGDLDGDETILKINIALNDTANPANIISLDGAVRTITLRTREFESANPLMEILIEGLETNIHPEKLSGLKFDDYNILYVQAEDISGAKTKFISLPDTASIQQWFVKKPVSNLLIVDDYMTLDNTAAFYDAMFDTLGLTGSYDVYDIHNYKPPFKNITFLETIKLFDYIFWYTDNNPSIDLAAFSTQRFLNRGGKVAFSMQFPQEVDPLELQSFIPILANSISSRSTLLSGTILSAEQTDPLYPQLQTTISVFRVKSFYLSTLAANPVYYYPNGELNGFAGFTNPDKSLFFIALPLDRCNGGNGNVKELFEKVFFQDFGIGR
jgi:hypothetical protein